MNSFAQNFSAALPLTRVAAKTPSPHAINVFAGILAAGAVGLAGLLVYGGSGSVPLAVTAILAGVAILAERQPVRVSANLEITVTVLPVVFAAVVFGPIPAMAVGALALVLDFRPPYVRWLTWTSMRALAGGAAGLAASAVLAESSSFGRLSAAVVLAAFTEAVVDATLGALVVAIRGTGSVRGYLRLVRPILIGTVPLYAPVLLLLVYGYQQLSAWSLVLFLAPAVAAHRLYGLYRQQQHTTGQLRVANDRLERASLSFATALVAALDARDQYTAGHSAAVAVYARDIASRLGLSEEAQQLAHLCGLVHDIGKVGLPVGLLEKPGSLTLEERRTMEEHSVIGERILAKVDDYAEIARIVRHHHERVDGNGYPDRLRGEEIPLLSRILAVADAYNAMTSGRPYRDAMPSRVARFRLAQASGSQFDTSIVAAFEAILAGSTDTYLSGARPDFALEALRQPALQAEPIATVA